MSSSKDWFDWSKLRETSEFAIGFFVTIRSYWVFFVKTRGEQLIFFWKKLQSRFLKKKKSTFFCLHLRLAKVPYGVRTPWYECLSFYIIIIIRHYFKHFTVSVFVNFCPICHHKNRTKNSKNFHCAFLFLSLYYPYLLQSLWRYSDFFFHTWIFY